MTGADIGIARVLGVEPNKSLRIFNSGAQISSIPVIQCSTPMIFLFPLGLRYGLVGVAVGRGSLDVAAGL